MLTSVRVSKFRCLFSKRNFRKPKYVHPAVTKLIPRLSQYCSDEQFYSSYHGKELSSILFHTANDLDYNCYSSQVKEINHLTNEKSNLVITFKLPNMKDELNILTHISCVMSNAPLSETLRVYSDYMNVYSMRTEYKIPVVNWNHLVDIDLSQLVPKLAPYNNIENRYFWKKLTKILFRVKNYDNYKDNEHFNKFTCDSQFPNENIPYYILCLMRNSNIVDKLDVYQQYISICDIHIDNLPKYHTINLYKYIPKLSQYEYNIHCKALANILFYARNCYSHKGDKVFQEFVTGLKTTNKDIMYHIDMLMKDAADNDKTKVFHQYITLYDALVETDKQSCILYNLTNE